MKVIWLLTALVAGMMAPVQAGFNGKMGRAIRDPVFAALISFFVGTLGLLVYGVALRMDFTALR
ncbi:MAG TPA: DMT family transporter, partial [Desulfotignum sp.]|nr:DMT family transporter [Desulfotignum sp.]